MHSPAIGRCRTAALAVVALTAAGALAQKPPVQELRKLRDSLCEPQRVIPAAEGEAALAKLRAWNLSPDALKKNEHIWLLETELYAALATGDAGRAAELLNQLQVQAPEPDQTRAAAHLVHAARGDGAAALEALKASGGPGGGDAKSAARRRWLKQVGSLAPEVELVAADGTKLSARARHGIVLLVDFWNTRGATREYAAALRTLKAAHAGNLRLQFVGVNWDAASNRAAAKRFAQEAYAWPQVYEGRAAEAPLTHRAFQAGAPPWTVVIDGQGRVRAVGDAREPAIAYALRAALVEAGPKPGGPAAGPARPPEPQVGKGDLPSNDEAEALLRQARTYIRTGFKTKAKELLEEIIRKYPGTRQAREAEERLQLLR
jgi:hypothetical protein